MKKAILNILLIVCIVVFGVCAWKLYGFWDTYHTAQKEYDAIAEDVVSSKGKGPENREINFAKLLKTNPDVIGWIYVPGTKIDYPIVQGKDNEEYLHKTFDGTRNACGAIFMDKDGHKDFSAEQNIIYGHHMRNGSMFAALVDLRDQSYYKKHKQIYIYTPDKTRVLKIIGGYARPATVKIPLTFGQDKERVEYLQDILSRSDISTGFKINKKNIPNIYSFVTCSYEREDNRTFIHAVEKKVIEK